MKKALAIFTLQGLRFLTAVRTGLEPATSAVTGRHSNQLNYRTFFRWGCKYESSFFGGQTFLKKKLKIKEGSN
jgi:hypothetical protein